MHKRNITVYQYNRFKQSLVKEFKVNAWCVQGETGFLAFFLNGNYFYIAAGDDGHWWVIHEIHKNWIPEIKEVMKEFITYRK